MTTQAQRERMRAYYRANKEKWTEAYYRNHEQTLKRRAENRRKNPERIKAERQRFRERHLAELRAQEKAWREAHPDLMREYKRAYEKRVGLDQTRERKRKVALEMYERDPEKLRARTREWRRKHPDIAADTYARSRAKRRSAPVTGKVNRSEIWLRDAGICHICETPADPAKWHLDHVIPLSRGGTHGPENVAVSHPACNHRKSAHLLEEMTLCPSWQKPKFS